jgi:ribosomal protein S10
MTFVTKLTLQSGDRAALDDVVSTIATFVERKGAELKGPHPKPPKTLGVPQHKRTTGEGGRFPPWKYTVYTRTLEIVGHDEVARRVTQRPFPDGVHVEVEIERIRSMGSA